MKFFTLCIAALALAASLAGCKDDREEATHYCERKLALIDAQESAKEPPQPKGPGGAHQSVFDAAGNVIDDSHEIKQRRRDWAAYEKAHDAWRAKERARMGATDAWVDACVYNQLHRKLELLQ
jgi:hypothetical protein